MESHEECSICLDKLESQVIVLNCRHHFHEECIASYVIKSNNLNERFHMEEYIDKETKFFAQCPLCRSKFYVQFEKATDKSIFWIFINMFAIFMFLFMIVLLMYLFRDTS